MTTMTTYQPVLDGLGVPAQRTGERDPATLPHTCRCGARWAGSRTAHCAAQCHRSYSGVSIFDAHRRGGQCLHPAALGMSLIAGRAYECWGYRSEVED